MRNKFRSQNTFFWLSITLLLIIVGFGAKSADAIYVKPLGIPGGWSGGCDESCGSSPASPCTPSSNSVVNNADVECDLVLVEGSWPNFEWTNTRNRATHLTFDTGFGLAYLANFLTIRVAGDLDIVHHGLSSFQLDVHTSSSSVNVSGNFFWTEFTFHLIASATTARVTIGGFAMQNSMIKLSSEITYSSNIHLTLDGLISDSDLSTYNAVSFSDQSANYNYSLKVQNCSFSTSTSTATFLSAPLALRETVFIDSEVSNFMSIVSFADVSAVNVLVTRSSILNIHDIFIDAPSSVIGYLQVGDHSTISGPRTKISNSNSQLLVLELSDSTISGMTLNSIARFKASSSILNNTIVVTSDQTTTELALIDTLVSCADDSSYFELSLPETTNPEFIGAKFSGCTLLISTSVTFSGLANFTVNKLSLTSGVNVTIPSFTVTDSLSSASSRTAPIIRAPHSGPSEWTFHSMTVSNVYLDLYSPKVLNIHITQAYLGLLGAGSTHFGMCPAEINLFWDLPFPSRFTLFHMIDHIGAPSGNVALHVPPGYPVVFDATHSRDGNETLYCTASPIVLIPTLPIPDPTTCPTPIPVGFTCVDGVLVSRGSIEVPSISFPPSTGTVIVIGNLSVSETVVFRGIGSSLNVTGCASIKEIEIDVSDDPNQHNPKSVPKGSVVLVQQGSGCSNSLIDTKVTIKQKQSCKSIKSRNESDNRQLSVIFTLDTKKCNDKWIILGSVLGGILLLVVILMLVFAFNKSARNCIRPFAQRRKQMATF